MLKGFLRGKLLDKKVALDEIPQGKIQIPSEPPLLIKHRTTVKPDPQHDQTIISSMPPNINPSICPDEPITQCMWRASTKDNILAIPGFPHPVAVLDPPRYAIKSTRGVGINMVASMAINVGDLIVAERPMTLYEQGLLPMDPVSSYWATDIMQICISRLTIDDYEDYFALHNYKGYTRPEILGIADSNSVHIEALPGCDVDFSAVCKVISRTRHR